MIPTYSAKKLFWHTEEKDGKTIAVGIAEPTDIDSEFAFPERFNVMKNGSKICFTRICHVEHWVKYRSAAGLVEIFIKL